MKNPLVNFGVCVGKAYMLFAELCSIVVLACPGLFTDSDSGSSSGSDSDDEDAHS